MRNFKSSTLGLAFVLAACSAGEGGGEPAPEQIASSRAAQTSSAVRFNFVKTADWGSGYNARVDVTNLGPDPIQGWEAQFDMPLNVEVNVDLPPQNWTIFNTVGIENDVRISLVDSSNVIGVGQTRSVFLYGDYEGAFGFPTRCRAPSAATFVPCDGSADVTAPSAPSNVRILGTGSTIADLVWDPATDAVGVTGYLILFQSPGAPALEIGEVPATLPVTRARITRLSSETSYQFLILARDAAGNVSASASSPQTRTAVPGLSASFGTVNTWPGGGFQGAFSITNNEAVAIDNWQVDFTFTGTFQSAWDGQIVPIQGTQDFRILAPAHNLRLDPGETALVGVTGTFGTPPTPPTNFRFRAANSGVRPLATPQPPCLGLTCPTGTHCAALPGGQPTCVPD